METNELKELAFSLVDKAAEKNIAKISVKSDDFSITVETHAPAAAPVSAVSAVSAAAGTENQTRQEEKLEGTVVYAPLVGTFYAANAPEDPPLVSAGDSVSKGQTLCIIEAMKTMNSIESPCDGRISRVLVQNGDLVEYNQPIMVIE